MPNKFDELERFACTPVGCIVIACIIAVVAVFACLMMGVNR